MATFTVTNLDDSGTGSLRDAIEQANNNGNQDVDEIVFTVAGTIRLQSTLVITEALTIDGDNDDDGIADITITGDVLDDDETDAAGITDLARTASSELDDNVRLFNITEAAATTELRGLTLTGGRTTDDEAPNTNTYSGGAVRSLADLTITDGTVAGNSTAGNLAAGGGVFGYGSVTITDSTVSGNGTSGRDGAGGGVFGDSSVMITNTTVSGNSTTGSGARGGGVLSIGALTITNSTITGNGTAGDSASGGGIFAVGVTMLENSTVSGNSVAGPAANGGGVFGTLTAELRLENSIVLGNVANANGIGNDDEFAGVGTANPIANGQNIVGASTTVFDPVAAGVDANVFNADPRLVFAATTETLADVDADGVPEAPTGVFGGELDDNGGPVETIALLDDANNPALDVGDDGLAPATDARGEQRPVDLAGIGNAGTNTTDLGAFEQQQAQSFVVTTDLDVIDDTDGETSLREALALANADPTTADTITFVAGLAGSTILLTAGQLDITSNLTIDGDLDDDGGPDVTVDAQGQSRVFQVAGGTSTIHGLVITGGDAGTGNGGGINILDDAHLTLTNAVVSGNEAGDGGGLRVGTDASLSVSNATISDNTANLGGAMYNRETVTLTNTTLSGNYAGVGGAVFENAGGVTTLTNTTVSGNAASIGGGFYSFSGAGIVELTNSIVTGNEAAGVADDVSGVGAVTYAGGNIVGSALGTGGATPTDAGLTAADIFADTFDNDGVLAGVLANNGGVLETIALLPDGAAVDVGTDALAVDPAGPVPLVTDARGAPRLVDQAGVGNEGSDIVDLGAVEQQAPIVVDTLVDENDGIDVGGISLRDALAAIGPGGVITFDPSLVGGSTVGVDDGVIRLTRRDLVVDTSVSIVGLGADLLSVDAEGRPGGIFTIEDDDDSVAQAVTISGLTITGGRSDAAGGISNSENLTITASVISGNAASFGGGILSNGALTIVDSTVTGNSASQSGGGVVVIGLSATAIISNSTVYGNDAVTGGGILAAGADVLIRNSTISGNDGGGIVSADLAGVRTEIVSSIVAGNTGDQDVVLDVNGDGTNSFVSGGNNVIGNGDGAAGAFVDGVGGDQVGTAASPIDPLLGPLQNNGGPTPTLALLSGSPAINAGSNPGNLATDQRGAGFDRVVDGEADIGAFEAEATIEPATITVVKEVPVGDPATVFGFFLNSSEGTTGFQLDGGGDDTPPSERVFTIDPLAFGIYSVTETLAATFDSAFVVTDADTGTIIATGSDTSGDGFLTTDSFTVGAGDDIVVTFTNEAEPQLRLGDVVFSDAPDRSSPAELNGANFDVGETIYAFLGEADPGIVRVEF
ncbi:MAG: right-handed parallel beta-helix repeat-containing protein, partial [Pseudomonadota bacterium]